MANVFKKQTVLWTMLATVWFCLTSQAIADESAEYLPPSEVKWICPDEPFPDGIGKTRYYRHAFATKPGLVKATARWWVDDWGHVFVDGKKLPQSAKCTDEDVDLTALLAKPGRHVVAVEGRNLAGSGGVCLSIDLTYDGGRHESVYTDERWRRVKECDGGRRSRGDRPTRLDCGGV